MGKFICVPKGLRAMYDYYYGIWNEEDHHIWFLTDESLKRLWDSEVLGFMNSILNTLIDEYEEEDIFYQSLYFHREDLFHGFSRFQCKYETTKLRGMIDLAIDHKTLISFVL